MTVKEYAQDNGFIDARFLLKWEGYDCYEAIYSDSGDVNDIPMIGYPQIILQHGKAFRMANYDEAMEILLYL